MSNRHTILRISFSSILAIIGLSISMLTYGQESASSSSAPTGKGTVMIEQKNAFDGTLGSWLLLSSGSGETKGAGSLTTLNDVPAGSHTLFVEVPDGMNASVRLYKNEEQLDYVQRPQMTFRLADGEALSIAVHYSLVRSGVVSVQSDPAGLTFTMRGPNGMLKTGKTPESYDNSPAGQYTVQYDELEGCVKPAPKTDQLEDQGRISFNVTMACAAADKLRKRVETKGEQFVVIDVDGTEVTLRDVPQNAWFATHVFNAARKNVLGGYKDESGRPTGSFGPGNYVTVAELAAIAHRLGGVGEENFAGMNPENPNALNQWFSAFITSAEQRGWTLYKDATVDPLRHVTRAEVMVTLMQILDVPLKWQKGQMFTDVHLRTRYASAIETAAADGIVSGRTDANGKPTNTFGPEDPINRAEMAKVITNVFETYKSAAAKSSTRSR